MKLRIIIWAIILVTPTTLWFALTEDGNQAFHLIFNKEPTNSHQLPVHEEVQVARTVLIPVNPGPQHAAIMVHIKPAVAGAILIDNKNQKAGFNSITQEKFTEIPNASIEQENNTLLVKIEPSTETQYQLHVTSKDESKFQLAVRGISPKGEMLTKISSPWLQANRLSIYDIDLNKVKNMPLNVRSGKYKGNDFIIQREERVALQKIETIDDVCKNIKRIFEINTKESIPQNKTTFAFEDRAYHGCEFSFSATAEPEERVSAHIFYPHSNKDLAKDGWKAKLEYDGFGSSGWWIEKQKHLCKVHESFDYGRMNQPDYIPDNDYSISIACGELSNI